MKKVIIKQLLAAALVVLICCTILPATAFAGDEKTPILDPQANVRRINSSDRGNNATEKTYYDRAAALADKEITVYIPVKNYGTAKITDLKCVLPVSTDVDTFPFVTTSRPDVPTNPKTLWNQAQPEPQAWNGAALEPNDFGCFEFKGNLLPNVTSGVKTLVFHVQYQKEGDTNRYYNTVEVMIEVKEPASTPPVQDDTPTYSGGGGGSGFKNKPKVIVESYSFSSEKLFAGETFQLGVVIRNTSEKEAVKNMEITIGNDSGVVLPASGSGNSMYIAELGKGERATRTFSFQITPDADGKAQVLSVNITYDGTKNRQEFTTKTTITVPVLQKIRVRVDQPVIYDEAYEGQSVNMSVQMFNLGKSTLYNCMVEVIGEGLSLEETYYGGNVASGGTMRADLTLNTRVPGEIAGKVRITYEDIYGDPLEEILPFTVQVNPQASVEALSPEQMGGQMLVSGGNAIPVSGETGEDGPMGGAGVPWYVWVLAAAIAVVLILLLVIKAKQRRARALEDL